MVSTRAPSAVMLSGLSPCPRRTQTARSERLRCGERGAQAPSCSPSTSPSLSQRGAPRKHLPHSAQRLRRSLSPWAVPLPAAGPGRSHDVAAAAPPCRPAPPPPAAPRSLRAPKPGPAYQPWAVPPRLPLGRQLLVLRGRAQTRTCRGGPVVPGGRRSWPLPARSPAPAPRPQPGCSCRSAAGPSEAAAAAPCAPGSAGTASSPACPHHSPPLPPCPEALCFSSAYGRGKERKTPHRNV